MDKITLFFNKNLKAIFWGLLALQLVTMLVMSQQVGISADEYRHIKQAHKVYTYYETGGENKAALENTGIDPMQFNGQSFDNLMYFFTKKFDVKNYMEMRHFFNALLGWLIILLTGFIAKEFWGYKGAILAVFLLFIAPRFLGHSLNNNKDIPFAFGFILSFYGIILFLKDLPKLKAKSIIILTLGVAAAISIRIAGLLSIGFLGIFSAVLFLTTEPIKQPFHQSKGLLFKRLLLLVPAIAIVGYFIGIAFWPFMMTDPIENLKKVLDATSAHPISLNQLFEGRLVMSNSLPSYYSLKWTVITYPLIIMLGAALAVVLFKQAKKKDLLNYFYIVFAFIFVLAWMSLRQSNFYGAIRHLLFIYPLAILIAVIGFKFLSEYMAKKDNKWLQLVPIAAIILFSIHPVSHIIRNYPYSYVYFNELSGGIDNTSDKFETDYFQHSLRHATTWFVENELPKVAEEGKKVIMTSNDDKNCRYFTRGHEEELKVTYSRYYEKYANDWDYAIFYCGYISPEQITNKQWPPAGTIHTETVDGFPIAAVVKRQSKEDLAGFKALEKNPQTAKQHFEKFLKDNPANEQVLEAMAKASLYTRDFDKAITYATQAIEYNPRSIGALWVKNSALMAAGRYKEVLAVCDQITASRPSFYQAYYNKGLALKMMGQPNKAVKEFVKALGYNPQYYEAYIQMGEIYINYKQYGEAVDKIYGAISKFRPNDLKVALLTAKCYHFMNNGKNADQIINSIPAKFHSDVDYVIVKSRIDIKKGNLPAATQLLDNQASVNNNAELFVVRGILAKASGDLARAKQNFEMALRIESFNNEAKEQLQNLNAKPAAPKAQPQAKKQKSMMYN